MTCPAILHRIEFHRCTSVRCARRLPSRPPLPFSSRSESLITGSKPPQEILCQQRIKEEGPNSSLFFHAYALLIQQMSHHKRISEGLNRNIEEHIHSQPEANLLGKEGLVMSRLSANYLSVPPSFDHPSPSLDSITMTSTHLRVLS